MEACPRTTGIHPVLIAVALTMVTSIPGAGQSRQLYFGDTHLHTSYSPDAYFLGNRTADPDTAYRYAKGRPVIHPYHRARIQIRTPLDFLVVADHAEMLGVPLRLAADDPQLANTVSGKRLRQMVEEGKGQEVFLEFVGAINKGQPYRDLDTPHIRRSAWGELVAAAERHNKPGEFTSFIGWEWTSTPGGKNLHRVIFMPQGGEVARRFVPFSAFDSDKPEDLWAWLERTSHDAGATFVAIPHNSNISGGLMFDERDSSGRPITADYARRRMTWEPVVEMTQIKGDSETHPILSATDEFADFEPFTHAIDAETIGEEGDTVAVAPGSYVRSAWKRGLAIETRVGVNPFKFGVIGSTDSHTGMSSAEEDNFHGKTAFDSTPENVFGKYLDVERFGVNMSAAGLAGVWAEENTRDSIFAAFQRKEVYATTGPRIRLRFFGGWGFPAGAADAPDPSAVGYGQGVPMGGDLTHAPPDKSVSFLVHAAMDPAGARLDRIQIVKGWLDRSDVAHEKIVDVALSDGRVIRPDGTAPHVGNTVDVATARYTNSIGATQLSAVWTDPDFDPQLRAFYYARVLEIPTPRHTLYDAVALGIDHPENRPPTIQERAYSSPIWYTP
jgi:hypothetical protein